MGDKDRASIAARLKRAASVHHDSAPGAPGTSSSRAIVGPIPNNYADLPREKQLEIASRLATAMQKALLPKKT